MKNTLIAFLLFTLTTPLFAQEDHKGLNYETIEEAQKASKKDGKPILIDANTLWCGPCKMLAKSFEDKEVAAYLTENFHIVNFNAEGNEVIKFNGVTYENPDYKPENKFKRNSQHQLARKLNVTAYPTIMFVDSKGELFKTELGYRTPAQLMDLLKAIVADQSK
ncbi:MAG: thioredoxin family protein [Crocinitomicaceae bacterium]|nr:thioredoxin family protein [Crocinitomicaceae bacterium]